MGVDGLIESVNLFTFCNMPGVNVAVVSALSIMCLWSMAWISLKYRLLVCLVSGSGG